MSSSHSSSTSIESFESQFLITCGMCLKDYDEDREPKFLPCAHTFCKLCLTEIKQHTEIKCPICRKIHPFSEDVSTMPNNNYVESLIEFDIKLADVQARERDSMAQSIELRRDVHSSLLSLSEFALKVETEMAKRLRKEIFVATQIGTSPFGSKIDCFLSELRMLLNSPAPARDQLTTASEAVCSWFQKHKMDNEDLAILLIELESRMIEMENREKDWMFQSRKLKKDLKSSLVTLTDSIHEAKHDILKQLENNEVLAVANVRKSECDIYFQAGLKLDTLWEKRLPICEESRDFQRKMQQYLAFVIQHSLSDDIAFIWIEQQRVHKVSLGMLSNRDTFISSPEGLEVPVDLSNTPYRDLCELYSALIFALATAVINSSIEDNNPDIVLNRTVLKRWTSSILKRYIDESDSSGMQLIFVVQTLVAELQHPKGLMQEIFEVLYEEGLLSWVIDPSIVVAPSVGESGFQRGSKLIAYLISDVISSYMADKSLHKDILCDSTESDCEIILQ
uniref:RING-type domain-containing protein n=1 Tax=Daphnia galeata TaxID=27404 RepID=A0A8J2RFZ3_9CRUS|nr:unnamed protein product [Daphnia galeata]